MQWFVIDEEDKTLYKSDNVKDRPLWSSVFSKT